MITPLLHITLPEDDGDDRHFAPILLALEGIIPINEWHIRRALKRAEKGQGEPIPPLYASGVFYQEDPPGEENWRDCLSVLAQGHGDCVPLSSLVLRSDYELVPLCALRPGDRIMGASAWTEVRETVATGEKEILSFRLSNGCTLRCSHDHRLFRDVDGRVEEIRAIDAKIGDDLLTPDSVPLAPTEQIAWPPELARLSAEDRAWLLGKQLGSMRFASRESVQSALQGLAADAHIQESAIIYGTTSPRLALQLRVLHRMLGQSVSIKRVDDHGGLGENPIYRVVPRLRTREGYAERREKKFARIREIADGGVELCGDIETDSGRFWLPESDVLVHNCDNLVAWRVAELRVAGIAAEPVVKWQHLPREVAMGIGYPGSIIPDGGIAMVHCSVRMPDGTIEDVSKNLGMGGNFTNNV